MTQNESSKKIHYPCWSAIGLLHSGMCAYAGVDAFCSKWGRSLLPRYAPTSICIIPSDSVTNGQRILATLLAFTTFAGAGTLRSESEIRSFTDGVMGSIAADNLDGAFKQISEYLVLSEAELAPIKAQLQLQMPNLIRRFGAPAGFDFIESKQKGSSLLSMTYVAQYEKHAMPWTFYFYRTPGGWMLNTFRSDETFIRLFSN